MRKLRNNKVRGRKEQRPFSKSRSITKAETRLEKKHKTLCISFKRVIVAVKHYLKIYFGDPPVCLSG